ncbi:MAG TPA: hypothetical protein VIT41_17995 [Microlunatus sp.]
MLAWDSLLLGLDSAVVGFAAAPLLRGRRGRIMLAVACGVADGVASALGALIGRPWGAAGEALPALLLALYGLAVLAGSAWLRWGGRRATEGSRAVPGLGVGTCLVLPVLLSVDNLLYPTPALGAGGVIGLAASSAALMLLGLWAGSVVARRWVPLADRGARDLWAGAGFVVAALVVVVA